MPFLRLFASSMPLLKFNTKKNQLSVAGCNFNFIVFEPDGAQSVLFSGRKSMLVPGQSGFGRLTK